MHDVFSLMVVSKNTHHNGSSLYAGLLSDTPKDIGAMFLYKYEQLHATLKTQSCT
jgi:hypothetical protein